MPAPIPYTPLSYVDLVGNGTNTAVTVPFPFLKREHVGIYLGLQAATGSYTTKLVDGVGYTWTSDTLITLTTPIANGQPYTLRRVTPKDRMLVEFSDGSNLTARDLNIEAQQILYVAQELSDAAAAGSLLSQAVVETGLGSNEFGFERIANAAVLPTAPTPNMLVELVDTTGVQGVPAVVGEPAGFVGSSALSARLRWSGTAWNWLSYAALDPDGRYWRKSGGRVSVRDFGAVGDGTTNDSAAISAAINAVFPKGTVVFPEGTYFVNSRIFATGAGPDAFIELVGDGATGGATEIRAGTGISNGSMITFVDSNCAVSNLYFNANTATNATALEFQGDNNNGREYVGGCIFTTWEKAIAFRTDSYTVTRCYSIGCTNFIVGENWAMNGSITDNYVLGGRRSVWLRKDYTAASPQQAEGVRITDNCFLNTLNNAIPIDIQSALETLIEGNIIDQTGSFGVGINLKPVQAGDAISYTKIQNNWICAGNGATGACVIADSSLAGTDVSRVWVVQNTLLTSLSNLTGNKPAVYLNLVNTYWLLSNSVFTGSTVPLFLPVACFNGLQFGNHSRVTADASVTRNTFNAGIDFTNSYSLSIDGTVYETLGPSGLKTFKSAAGNTINLFTYNGIPEGNVAAPPGSLCFRTDSGQLYLKEGTGTGNTGWQLMVSSAVLSAVLNAGLNISTLYSLSVGGTVVETVNTQGVKTFKSAAGGTVSFITYAGFPENNVTANPGSICLRTDSGQLYVKQGTGTGNTGWVLK